MTEFQRIFGMAKADFLERVRKFSFPAFAAAMVFTVFWLVPRPSGFTALVIEPDQLLQGSDPSWIPMSSAMCGGMLLCLLGFAYIRNTVQHDRDIGIFRLVQVSPLKRSSYLFGKYFSNVSLLLLLLGFLMASSFVTMAIHFPGRFIPLYAFVSPFLCVVPGLFFVAAFALLTDCMPVFRKSSGLSIAVFFCFSILILTFATLYRVHSRFLSIFDFSGYLWMHDSISSAAVAVTGQPVTHISLFTNSHETGAHLKALAFHGLTPSVSCLADKLILIAFSLILTFFASFLLPVSQKADSAVKKQNPRESSKISAKIPFFHFGLIHSEAMILFKDRGAFWWAAAVCLWIANLVSPMDTVRGALFPIALAWMLPVFSKMGCLEHQTGVAAVLRTIPKAPFLLTLACWNTGLAVSLFTALPVLLRLLFSNHLADFVSILAVAVAVPSFSLCLGEWTKTNRPFETLFLIFCYLAINVPELLFAGDYFTAASALRVGVLILITGAMLFLTFTKTLAQNFRTA